MHCTPKRHTSVFLLWRCPYWRAVNGNCVIHSWQMKIPEILERSNGTEITKLKIKVYICNSKKLSCFLIQNNMPYSLLEILWKFNLEFLIKWKVLILFYVCCGRLACLGTSKLSMNDNKVPVKWQCLRGQLQLYWHTPNKNVIKNWSNCESTSKNLRCDRKKMSCSHVFTESQCVQYFFKVSQNFNFESYLYIYMYILWEM